MEELTHDWPRLTGLGDISPFVKIFHQEDVGLTKDEYGVINHLIGGVLVLRECCNFLALFEAEKKCLGFLLVVVRCVPRGLVG